jgi:hypothetical protein
MGVVMAVGEDSNLFNPKESKMREEGGTLLRTFVENK